MGPENKTIFFGSGKTGRTGRLSYALGRERNILFLSGKGIYNDNGNKVDIEPGMVTFTPSGQGHSIINTGDENICLIALILVD